MQRPIDIVRRQPLPRRAAAVAPVVVPARRRRRNVHPNFAIPAAAVIVLSLFIPIFNASASASGYDLSKAGGLLTTPTHDLQSKLIYDAASQSYVFNKNASSELPGQTADSSSVGGLTYSATLPLSLNPSTNLSLTDAQTKNTIQLTPQFMLDSAKEEQGHVVYPLISSNAQLVYTPEQNGLKEDIVLYNAPSDTASFSYKLQLPDGMVARLQKDGSIGIYGGDASLFGNVSASDTKDQALLAKARQNSEKTTLYYAIPAPVVKGSSVKAYFSLSGETLTVTATNLAKTTYPLSIDPSFVMNTTNCGWNSGTDDGGLSLSGCSLSRSGLTGGTVGSWTTNANTLGKTCYNQGLVIVNDYMYEVGGCGGDAATQEQVYYATVNSSTGAIGVFNPTTSMPNPHLGGSYAVYNGYIYALGGDTANGLNVASIVDYAKTNTDGTISSWTTSSVSLSQARAGLATTAYNGRLYVIGGCKTTGTCNITSNYITTVEWATLNADGSLTGTGSTFNTGTALSNGTTNGAASAYNGYLYFTGGNIQNGTISGSTLYIALNSDGSMGSAWTTTSSLPGGTTIQLENTVVYQGYLYVLGGNTGSLSNAVYFAPIYANGALGAYQTTTSFATARSAAGATAANGYLYIGGGCIASCSAANSTNNLQYTKINPAGETSSYFGSGTYNSSGIITAAYVAYNGYLYVIGGTTANSGAQANQLNTVRYAPINADGSLLSWTTSSTSFNNTTSVSDGTCHSPGCAGRVALAAGVYNGYLYIAGGMSNGTQTAWSDVQSTQLNASTGAPGTWTTQVADWVTNSASVYSDTDGEAGVAMQIYNGYMYLIGGGNVPSTTAVMSSSIYYAPLTTSGGVGTFNSTVSLPSARANVKTFMYGGKLYIVGGGTATWAYTTNDADDVQYISINSSTGALTGSWTDANAAGSGGSGSSFATANSLQDYAATVNNNFLYIAGGQNGNGTANSFATVYKAPFNSNGSLGSWTTTTSFATGRYQAGAVAYNGNLYIIGGCSNKTSVLGSNCNSTTAMQTDYQYAQINNGGPGVTGSWTTSGNLTVSGVADSGGAVSNGYLYILGSCTQNVNTDGSQCAAETHAVQYAQINSDGSLGTWSTTTASITALTNMSVATYNGYIYVMGGCTSYNTGLGTKVCNGTTNVIQYASANGNITSWTTSSTVEPASITSQGGAAVAVNGFIYLTGVNATSKAVYYTQINQSTHDVGSWTTSGNSILNITNLATLVSTGSYLYLIGGNDSVNAESAVQYAPINSDGSVGAWKYTYSMNYYRYNGIVAGVYNGFIYAASGYDQGGGGGTKVEYAPILANGALGAWQVGTSLSAYRRQGAGGIYNGYIYDVGGLVNNSNSLRTADYAPLQSIPDIARYSIELTTDKDTTPANFYITATPETVSSNLSITYETATIASPAFSSSTRQNYVATGTKYPITISGDGVAYYWLCITLDDTQSAYFGDTPSSISYLQLNYHPNSTMRLRGGKTFNSNALQSLDAP